MRVVASDDIAAFGRDLAAVDSRVAKIGGAAVGGQRAVDRRAGGVRDAVRHRKAAVNSRIAQVGNAAQGHAAAVGNMGLIGRKRAAAREVALDSCVIGIDGTRVRHRAFHCDIAKGGVARVREVTEAAVGVVGHKAAAVAAREFKAVADFKARAGAGFNRAGEVVVAAGGRTRHRELAVDHGVAQTGDGASALIDRTKGKAAFSCADGDVAARHGEIIHAAGINRERRIARHSNFSEVARANRNSGPVKGGGTGSGGVCRQGAVRYGERGVNGNRFHRHFGRTGDRGRTRVDAAGGEVGIGHRNCIGLQCAGDHGDRTARHLKRRTGEIARHVNGRVGKRHVAKIARAKRRFGVRELSRGHVKVSGINRPARYRQTGTRHSARHRDVGVREGAGD